AWPAPCVGRRSLPQATLHAAESMGLRVHSEHALVRARRFGGRARGQRAPQRRALDRGGGGSSGGDREAPPASAARSRPARFGPHERVALFVSVAGAELPLSVLDGAVDIRRAGADAAARDRAGAAPYR